MLLVRLSKLDATLFFYEYNHKRNILLRFIRNITHLALMNQY